MLLTESKAIQIYYDYYEFFFKHLEPRPSHAMFHRRYFIPGKDGKRRIDVFRRTDSIQWVVKIKNRKETNDNILPILNQLWKKI